MSIFQYNIEELEQLGATAASLQYRTDAADELTLSVIPVAYGEAFPWQSLDRVELFAVVEGQRRCVFSGVVPMRAEDRAFREAVGRALCVIAQEAQQVTRCICSVGVRIK